MPYDALDTKVRRVDAASLAEAKALLLAGDVVAVPTETVYGLAADATHGAAVSAIYGAKGRPSFNPLIVHVEQAWGTLARLEQEEIVDTSSMTPLAREMAQRLMDLFWPGPLTIVLPRGEKIAPEASGGLDTVALRMPDHPDFQALLVCVGVPLAAPSANRSKRISPTSAEHVLAELGGRIPLILDGGPTRVGVESTIVAVLPDGGLKLLRPGGVPAEKIASLASALFVAEESHGTQEILAPGMMLEHYAPGKPLAMVGREQGAVLKTWIDTQIQNGALPPPQAVGLLLFGVAPDIPPSWTAALPTLRVEALALSDERQGEVAASRLFAALRGLDAAEVDFIVVELPRQEGGLWPAIRDRLTRAAARWSLEDK